MTAELRAIDAEPIGQSIIPLLEQALEQARNGELSAVSLAKVYRDGCGGHAYSFLHSAGLMVGTIARMQYAIMKDMDE